MAHIRKQVFIGLTALLLCAGHGVAGEENFTIAVASDSQKIDGQVSTVAARAPYFLFFDNEGSLLEAVANPHADAAGGVGPHTANFLADKQIKVVVAGRFGTKMKNALNTAEIEYLEKQGSILDSIKGVIHAK